MKILNFDKLQSPKFNSFKDMTGFLRLNYENINLQKDIRNSRCLIIDSSLFHSNQMKTRKIDHSDWVTFVTMVGYLIHDVHYALFALSYHPPTSEYTKLPMLCGLIT